MQLKNAPQSTGSSFLEVPGVNAMYLVSWSIAENPNKQGAKQLEMVFSNRNGETPQTYKGWMSFNGAFTEDKSGLFLNKLSQYVDVIVPFVGKDEAAAHYDKIMATLLEESFDESDMEAVQNFEEKFVSQLFSVIPENSDKKINVVLHYRRNKTSGKWFLNVPYYNENVVGKKWCFPFGANPSIGDTLVLVRPEEQQEVVHQEVEPTQEVRQELPGEDLPF